MFCTLTLNIFDCIVRVFGCCGLGSEEISPIRLELDVNMSGSIEVSKSELSIEVIIKLE